jgi:antitoxin component of MazEF toxin-antitoxin module
MVQKVIKIGSSLGVTIPKKQLDELGIGVGDEVKIKLEPLVKDKNQEKLMREYDKFVQQYGSTLKNLASR